MGLWNSALLSAWGNWKLPLKRPFFIRAVLLLGRRRTSNGQNREHPRQYTRLGGQSFVVVVVVD